jgi:uncharacterized protein YbjT (DUF2867 family)
LFRYGGVVRIVVTGASGQLGRLTVEALITLVPASALILVTRFPHALADVAAKGAEVRHGDFGRPETLRAAFAGGSRALVVSILGPAPPSGTGQRSKPLPLPEWATSSTPPCSIR